MRSPRFWCVVLLMSLAALVLQVRGDVDRPPPTDRQLSEFPTMIGPRTSTDVTIDPGELEVLGKGIFLNRMYATPVSLGQVSSSERVPVSLYIAYFPTQRTGQSIHSPQHCLPGAGWTFQTSGVTDLTSPTGKNYSVGDYVITNGNSTAEVLYWYQMQGQSIANDYKAKLYTLANSIRYSRTDAALVRVITAIEPGEEPMEAHRRVVGFANQIVPLLPSYIPN